MLAVETVHLFTMFTTSLVKKQQGVKYYLNTLLIVGADYNKKARVATRNKMNTENITAEIVFGDISDPENLNKMLLKNMV